MTQCEALVFANMTSQTWRDEWDTQITAVSQHHDELIVARTESLRQEECKKYVMFCHMDKMDDNARVKLVDKLFSSIARFRLLFVPI